MDRIYDLYIFELVNRINFEKAMRQRARGEWLATRQRARGLDDWDHIAEKIHPLAHFCTTIHCISQNRYAYTHNHLKIKIIVN